MTQCVGPPAPGRVWVAGLGRDGAGARLLPAARPREPLADGARGHAESGVDVLLLPTLLFEFPGTSPPSFAPVELGLFRAHDASVASLKPSSQGSVFSLRALSFLNTLWPPTEQRRRVDQVRSCLERHTTLGLDIFELVDGGKVAIRQHGVGQRPEMLG
jgi:hypothetical protein